MENKHVGFIILGIALVLVLIIFLFQGALKEIVNANCGFPHAETCPMNEAIQQQTWLSLGIVGILIVIGSVLVFTKPKEKIVTRMVKKPQKRIDLSILDSNEKALIQILQKENGTMFQAALMEKLAIGKVSITRLLDKLEAKQIIERKRRGMNNIVILKN